MRFRHRDILMFEARVPGTSVRQAGAHDPANEDPAPSLSLSLSLSRKSRTGVTTENGFDILKLEEA